MKPKFKVGDRVVIARRVPGEKYGLVFLSSMAEHSGEISAIAKVEITDTSIIYALTTLDYWWSQDMLEPFVPSSKEEPKVLDFTPKKKHYQLNFSV